MGEKTGASNRYSFVITDVDGTIVDRIPGYTKIFADLVSEYGVSENDARHLFLSTGGTPLDQQLVEVLTLHGHSVSSEKIRALVALFFERARVLEAPLFPGAAEVLEQIKSKELRLCATSGSNTEELETIFALHKLPYDVVLGSNKIKKGDAHIAYFANHFVLQLREFCQQAIYVGDGPMDMIIARQNNIVAVGVTTTVNADALIKAGANYIIHDIREVIELV